LWSRSRPSKRLPRAERFRKGDEGVILVLWVLALAALAGFLALVIDLGNLEQSSDNVQNAADSAAISAADVLGPNVADAEPLSTLNIPLSAQCQVYWVEGVYYLDGCAHLRRWLGSSYSIYEGGAWLTIGTQISASQAFSDGTQSNSPWGGPWTCSQRTFTFGGVYCTQLTTNVSAWPWADNALAHGADIDQFLTSLAAAANDAESLVQHAYSVSSNWTSPSCELQPYPWADAAAGRCLEYEIVGSDAVFAVNVISPGSSLFFADDGITSISKHAWASSATGLCLSPVTCS
jgi:hypothetical protein